MGRVIDTSVLVASERRRWTAKQTIQYLQELSDEPHVLSAIAAAELITGIYRAETSRQMTQRASFVRDILEALPPMPFTKDTAWVAGQLRGEQSRLGNTLPLADSLIAAAALQMSFSVLTLNVADFVRIPNLHVVPFVLP